MSEGAEVSRSNVKKPTKYKSELKSKIEGRPKNLKQMELKANFLISKFTKVTNLEEIIVDGHYTTLAWSAWDVGERPPKNLVEAKLLAQKGQRMLDRVFRLKNLK